MQSEASLDRRLIFLIGSPRSGSTLLARMLGLAEESAYMGEESGTPAPPDLKSLAAALGVELPEPEEEEEEEEEEDYDKPYVPPKLW